MAMYKRSIIRDFFFLEPFYSWRFNVLQGRKGLYLRNANGKSFWLLLFTGELNGGGVDAKIIARSKEGSITVKTQSWFDSLGLGT